MNEPAKIQNVEIKDEPLTWLRAATALSEGLTICRTCYDRIEFKFVFTCDPVPASQEICYICGEGPYKNKPRRMYKVSQTEAQSVTNRKAP